jgi:hypothetical protein
MTIVGEGDFRYEVDTSWPKGMPENWTFDLTSDIAVDSKDRVWVFSRGLHPVTYWSTDGKLLGSWGEGFFREPHGIFIDKQDNIWLTEKQRHIVTKHDQAGNILLELGTRDYAQVTVGQHGHFGLPFNSPSGVAIAANGDIYVSDGYGNHRVHHFSPQGKLLNSWGKSGTGPGEFTLLHKVGIDSKGRIYICDRENNRIQVFDPSGKYLTEWKDVAGPGDTYFHTDGMVYVVEQGGGNGVSIWTEEGKMVTRWRGNKAACEAAHGCAVDSEGTIYVAEIGQPGHGQRVRKFVRV